MYVQGKTRKQLDQKQRLVALEQWISVILSVKGCYCENNLAEMTFSLQYISYMAMIHRRNKQAD